MRGHGGSIKYFFITLLLCTFAALALIIAVAGAKVYSRVNSTAKENDAKRTALAYVAGKLRAGDKRDCVAVSTVDGISVLSIISEYDSGSYTTYLYCSNGGLREYFSASGRAFNAASGDIILDVDSVEFTQSGALITVTASDSDATNSLDVMLRAYGGGA